VASSGPAPAAPCLFCAVGAPELDTGLPGGSHQSRGAESPPSHAAHAAGDADQGTVGFLGCERTLMGHVELLINQQPEVLLLKAALDPFSTQLLFVLGIAPTHV